MLIRNLSDFCFEVRGRMINNSCYARLPEHLCKSVNGRLTSLGCEFRDTYKAQERIGKILLSPELSINEREVLIKEEIKVLPPEFKDFMDELVEITNGLNYPAVKDVLEVLQEEYKPVEERVKQSDLYDPRKPIEPQIRAFEFAHGIHKIIQKDMVGLTKEDKLSFISPAAIEARNQLEKRKNLFERQKQLLAFVPDESNREVWNALVKNPSELEVWDSNPKPYPEGIKRIRIYSRYSSQEEIWEVIDKKGAGAFISYNPTTNEYSMNSPHFEELENV